MNFDGFRIIGFMYNSSGMSSDARFDLSPIQLRQFLQGLVDRNLIEMVDGLYLPCKK